MRRGGEGIGETGRDGARGLRKRRGRVTRSGHGVADPVPVEPNPRQDPEPQTAVRTREPRQDNTPAGPSLGKVESYIAHLS